MRIISITSIPSRFTSLGPTLESLLGQGADEVRLNIPHRYRRFPAWDGALPDVPSGVSIVRCDQDYGPATKILPTVQAFSSQNVQILFCDDDCLVPRGWADRLFAIQARRAGEAVAVYVREAYLPRRNRLRGPRAKEVLITRDLPYRASRLAHKLFGTPVAHRRPIGRPGYGEVFFGVSGVVVRPQFFDAVATEIPDVAWPVDDIWLSAMLARKGVRIYSPWRAALPQSHTASETDALLNALFMGMSRQQLNFAASEYCRDTFGIWT